MNYSVTHSNSTMAFPRTAEYACAVQQKRRREDSAVIWVSVFAALFVLVMVVLEKFA